MKNKCGGILIATVVLASAIQAFAIESLQVRVQGSNAIVSWPSRTGETYIVQYRPTLNTNDVWATLTNALPAATGTNWTSFVHSNSVQYPTLGTNTSGDITNNGPPPPPGYDGMSAQTTTDISTLNADEIAALKEQRRQEAWAALAYMMEILSNTVAQAEANRQAWIAAGRPARIQNTAQTLSTTELDTSQSVTNTGFYRVVRAGVNFFGITNGQVFSGVVTLPVEIGWSNTNDVMTEVVIAPLSSEETEDTRPSGVELYPLGGTNYHPVLVWDTHRTTNGPYVLQAAVTLNGDSILLGNPVNVVVSNRIQMPKIADVMVSGLPIYAIVDQANAAYTITISNAQGQLVRTLTGQATNYVIRAFWDGKDSQGNNALVNHSYVDVTVSYNPSYKYRVWVFFEDAYLDGQWLIAYQKGLYSSLNELNLDNAMQQIADFAAEEGQVFNPYLQIRSGWSGWTSLTNYWKMEDCRNIYFWGHGSSTGIGFSQNNQTFGLRATNVQAALGNLLVTNLNEIQIRHAFRFVWLDGCNSGGKSSLWPRTFGITPVQLNADDFAKLGGARRAFLGWTDYINTAGVDSSRFTFAENFFQQWIGNGLSLTDALDAAAGGTIGTNERNKLQTWGDPQLLRQGPF